MIMEVLIEHDRLKNWEKLKGGEVWYINQLLDPTGKRLITWQQVKKLSNQRSSRKKATWFQSIENITLENSNTRKVKEEFKTQSPNSLALKLQCKPILKKRSKREWVIVDKNKENQPIIGERSSNKVLQERLSNRVKRARTEKLIDISPWVKYTKGEMNLQLEPDYFGSNQRTKFSSNRKDSRRAKQEMGTKGGTIVAQSKELEVILEKIKAHFGVKQNERADRIAKEGGEGIEIECSPRKFIKQLLTIATRAEWTFIQELYNKMRVWIKKEEILKSIKEELRQKDKIALGLDKLREVFIPRDIKEYKERHIEWSRGFMADKIGSSLERINISKNKAWDIAVAFLDEWEEKRRELEGEESINPEAGAGEKETVPNNKKLKRHWTEVLSIAKKEVYEWIGQ
ncbi:26465_t:CDS:2, partial [Gigaspora margarita]